MNEHGFPISYKNNDELTDKQALENLTKFGKITAPILASFVIGWSLQRLSAAAIETPDTPENPAECPANQKPTGTDIAPDSSRKPILDNILPPTQCLETNRIFQITGILSAMWVCVAALRLHNESLQLACVAIARYLFNFQKNSPNN